MKHNTTLYLLILFVLLAGGIAGKRYWESRTVEELVQKGRIVSFEDTDSISIIHVEHAGNRTDIVRSENGWMVGAYPASEQAVEGLISFLGAPGRVSVVSFGLSEVGAYGLGEDEKWYIEFEGEEGLLGAVTMGQTEKGTYFNKSGEENIYFAADAFSVFLQDDWREKRIVMDSPESITRIDLARNGKVSILKKEEEEWMLGNTPLDQDKVQSYLWTLTGVLADGFPQEGTLPEAYGTEMEIYTGDTTHNFLFEDINGEFTYVQNGAGNIYRIDNETAEKILFSTNDFQ